MTREAARQAEHRDQIISALSDTLGFWPLGPDGFGAVNLVDLAAAGLKSATHVVVHLPMRGDIAGVEVTYFEYGIYRSNGRGGGVSVGRWWSTVGALCESIPDISVVVRRRWRRRPPNLDLIQLPAIPIGNAANEKRYLANAAKPEYAQTVSSVLAALVGVHPDSRAVVIRNGWITAFAPQLTGANAGRLAEAVAALATQLAQ